MATFVLNDETRKNSHGFFLLNAGGRFERFAENPVMLHNHDLDRLTGKWLRLRIEGSQLLAEPEFDEADPEALKIKGKVERGYLRGASPGIVILSAEWRENPATKESEIYVTDWELYEGSTVSVPSNAGALTLKIYDSDYSLISDDQVKCHVENIVKLSLAPKSNTENKLKNETKMSVEMKLTAACLVALGLQETSDGTAISAAVVQLHADKVKAEKELKELRDSMEAQKKLQAEEMVNLAITAGKITADKKEAFVKLALSDPETAKATLDAIPVKTNLSAQVQPISGSTIPAGREDWTLLKWMKEDMTGLKKLQAEQPDVYAEILKKKQ